MLTGLLLLVAAQAGQDERGVNDLIARTPGIMAPPTVATRTVVDSTPVVQRTVVSSARVEDLMTFFTMAYQKAGLFISPEGQKFMPEKGAQVTGLDTENLIAYMALFQPSGKYTTVVIAAANMAKPNLQRGGDAIAPVYPGAHSLTSYRIELVNAMTYTCPGTADDIKKFYREQLAKAGFKETEEMVFNKEHSRVWLTITPGGSERGVAVYMQNTADGEPQGPPKGPLPPAPTAAPVEKKPATH
jgi:hypothetical protein